MVQIQAWQAHFHPGKLDIKLLLQIDKCKEILKLYTSLVVFVGNCPAGSFIDATVRSNDADYEEVGCRKCAKGFYQDKRAQDTCIMCDAPKTTELIGADSLDLCQCEYTRYGYC